MGDTSNSKSFWTTLPGIITGLAGLVTAIGGLLLVLNQTRVPASSPTETAPVSPTDDTVPDALAPSSTLPPTATSTPLPSPSSVEVGPKLVLSDSFNANENDWFTGEDSDEYATTNQLVANGKYRWEITAHRDVYAHEVPTVRSVSDFDLTVEAQRISGSENAAYGVVFRLVSDDTFYDFTISDTQTFSFALKEDGEWTTLIDWTSSSAIRPGEVNRLMVTAQGSHFVFSINGQIVGEADNGRLQSGTVGLAVDLVDAGDEAVFEFDNLELRAP
ncbi:MAG: hypothetical protein V3U69_02080 [Bacteroidota bacterium]